MSERLTSLLILALLGLGSPLQGQERERLARREAELAARLATLQASLVTNDSIRFADQKRTVVSAGAFHVAYPEWAARDAELRLPELLDGWRARYGVMVHSLVDPTFAHWLGESDPSLSYDMLRDGAIRGLVLSPSSRGRRCLDGMIDE